MTFEHIDFSLHDTVALMGLANPFDTANTLGLSAVRELREAAAVALNHRSVRILMITGKGRSFSAGAAIGNREISTEQQVRGLLREGQLLLREIMDLDIITIAAVNGLALGGGLEVTLACDIRWAHTKAVFGLPEVKLGLVPGWGGLSLLRRTIPASLSAEMILGGEFISARRAYEAGLVSRIFRERDFQKTAVAEGRKLADKPANALRELRALLRWQRGKVDLSAADSSFLNLWNDHYRSAETRSEHRGRAQ